MRILTGSEREEHAKKKERQISSSGVHRSSDGSAKSVESVTLRQQAKKGKLGLIGGLALGAGTVADFSSRMKNGDTPAEAALGAGQTAALGYVVGPGLYFGGMIAKDAVEGAVDVGEKLVNKTRDINRLGTLGPFASNRFIETRDTFTMRQAAMAAIGQARGNLENHMVGNEAGMLHK